MLYKYLFGALTDEMKHKCFRTRGQTLNSKVIGFLLNFKINIVLKYIVEQFGTV